MNIKKILISALLITTIIAPLSTFTRGGGGRGGHYSHGGHGGRGYHGRGYHGRGYHGRGYYGHGRGWGWGLGVGLGLGYLASGALDPNWRYYYGNRYWGYDDSIYGYCPYHDTVHRCYYRRTPCPDGTYRLVWESCR